MKKRSQKYSTYYSYMEPFFEKGNLEDIRLAKLAYRKIYKAKWRREHRKTIKEITVPFNKEEYNLLKGEAKKHKLSITRFIKKSTEGYINNRYLPLHQQEIMKLLQLVAMTYNRVEELSQDEKINNQIAKELKDEIDTLEKNIRVQVYSPKTIWQVLERVLTETPQLKKDLAPFIEQFT